MVLVRDTGTGDPQGHTCCGDQKLQKQRQTQGSECSAGDQVPGQFPQPFPGLGSQGLCSGSPKMLSS